MAYLLGIDIGTTNVKTIVLEAETGRTLASADREYPISQPQLGYAEQDPDDWWRAAVHTIQEALAQSGIDRQAVRAISLCGQMHGVTCIGADGRPLRPSIIWADTRSKSQCDALLARFPAAEMSEHAPGLPAAGFMGPTLMWLAQYEPETLRQTRVVLLPKDYVRYRLTGNFATDDTDAAGTWLFDVKTGDWSDWLMAACSADRRYLPEVHHSADVAGTLTAQAAAEIGLSTSVQIITGCADLPSQGIGHGMYEPGLALAVIGTGGQVFAPITEPRVDPQMRYYILNYPVPNTWYVQTAILSAGLSLRWLRDVLGLSERPDAYEHLSQLAAQTPPGADGLIFLPYLAGERTPHMDPAAAGLFLGLRLHHHAGHLARAVMEGVTFAMEECLSLVDAAAGQKLETMISGGAAKSPLWRQMQADIYQRPLRLAAGANHGAVGAALLAGIGAGLYTSFADACSRLPRSTTVVEPDPISSERYAEARALYRDLYPRLKDSMHRLSDSSRRI